MSYYLFSFNTFISADGGDEEREKNAEKIREKTIKEALMVGRNYYRSSEEFKYVEEAIKSEPNSPATNDDEGFIPIDSNQVSSKSKFEIYHGSREGEFIVPDMIESSGKFNQSRNLQCLSIDQVDMAAVSSEDQHCSVSNQTHNQLNDQSKTSLELQESCTKQSISTPPYFENIHPKETSHMCTLSTVPALDKKSFLSPSSHKQLLDQHNYPREKQAMVTRKRLDFVSKYRKILPAPENRKDTLSPLPKQQLTNTSQSSQNFNSGLERDKDQSNCNIKSSDSSLSKPFSPNKQNNLTDYTSFASSTQPCSSSSYQSVQNMSMQIQSHFTNPPSQISLGCVAHEVTSIHQSSSNRLVNHVNHVNHVMIQPAFSGSHLQSSTSNITTLGQHQFSINNCPINNQSIPDNDVQRLAHPQYERICQSLKNQNSIIKQPYSFPQTILLPSSGTTCTRESTTQLINPQVPSLSSFTHQPSEIPPLGTSDGQFNSTMMPQRSVILKPPNVYQKMRVVNLRPATSRNQNTLACGKGGRPLQIVKIRPIRPRE